MNELIAFFVGCVVGCVLGIFSLAVLVASRDAEEREQRMFGKEKHHGEEE